MTGFLLGAGVFILLTVLLGLLRILRGPGDAERVMAGQLLGTGGVAAILLLGFATDPTAATDLALVLVLLAAFVAAAFVAGMSGGRSPGRSERSDRRAQPPVAPRTHGDVRR
jgi:multicomponent Na+:H+ antiporter subunit F